MYDFLSSESHSNLGEFWSAHIHHRSGSGLSKAAYCKNHGLVYHKYIYWEQKLLNLNKSEKLIKLIPIGIEQTGASSIVNPDSVASAGSKALCSLTLPTGAILQIFDKSALNALIVILR